MRMQFPYDALRYRGEQFSEIWDVAYMSQKEKCPIKLPCYVSGISLAADFEMKVILLHLVVGYIHYIFSCDDGSVSFSLGCPAPSR